MDGIMAPAVILELVDIRQAAARCHCRIKEWKMTEGKAWGLAEQTFTDPFRAFENMKAGRAWVLGAPIRVIP